MKWLKVLIITCLFCTACNNVKDNDGSKEKEVNNSETKSNEKHSSDQKNEKYIIKNPVPLSKSFISNLESQSYKSPQQALASMKQQLTKNNSDYIALVHDKNYKGYSIVNLKYYIKEKDGALVTLGHVYRVNDKYKVKYVLVEGLFKEGIPPKYGKDKINGVLYEYYLGDISQSKIIDLQFQIVNRNKTTEFSMRTDISEK